MKLFGLKIGKEKAVPFLQFRDLVRVAVRRTYPHATAEVTETGFVLTLDGKRQNCNLRALYASYCKAPDELAAQIQRYVDSLSAEVPKHGWQDARATLRPMFKAISDLDTANQTMAKASAPDRLPYEPFVGEVGVIVMREVNGMLTGVTENQLAEWDVSFAETMRQAIDNMNMLAFPPVSKEIPLPGSVSKDNPSGEIIGLVFDGDHLTATWLLLERFRDNLFLRLSGDYVVSIPNRSRLIAIRIDEPGMIASVQQSHRNVRDLPYALTNQCFLVSAAQIGGVVSIYKPSDNSALSLAADGMFGPGKTQPTLPNAMPAASGGWSRPQPIDLSAYGTIAEPTSDVPVPTEKAGKKR